MNDELRAGVIYYRKWECAYRETNSPFLLKVTHHVLAK
jgi:hypothetical protein